MTFFENVSHLPSLQYQCLCNGPMNKVAMAAGTENTNGHKNRLLLTGLVQHLI